MAKKRLTKVPIPRPEKNLERGTLGNARKTGVKRGGPKAKIGATYGTRRGGGSGGGGGG